MIVAAMAAVGLVAIAAVLWTGSSSASSPDPGGEILAQLKPVGYALPANADVLYRNDVDPMWDSCDGRPGTFGWDNVIVQIHFTSKDTPDAVLANAGAQMSVLGWQLAYGFGDGTTGWTKVLRNGTSAKAQLEQDVGGWTLMAFAPPVGPRVSGC